jgi:molybdopterin synthase catalytic subunit
MKVRIVFYGGLKQDVGTKEQVLEFPQETVTVEELSASLGARYPGLTPRLSTVAYVVNDEIVDPWHLLHDGDEAGLLPPVSGG